METGKYTADAVSWLQERYGTVPINILRKRFAAEFGWEPTARALYVKCSRLGIGKDRLYGRDAPERAVCPVRWSCEPEKQAWMEGHDDGSMTVPEVSRAFEREFGFPLSRPQVVLWRQENGRQSRRSRRESRVPVGTERVSKGYTVVKVQADAARPGTKDNWRMKSHVEWERANGRPLPPEHNVVHGNGDTEDYSPENLVAVPRSMVSRINSPDSPEWHDAEELRACMAWCELHSAIISAERAVPRRCGVCGREFSMPPGSKTNNMTCPECIAQGRRSKGERRSQGDALCAVCGSPFTKRYGHQRRCPECIAKAPKKRIDQQRREHARLRA